MSLTIMTLYGTRPEAIKMAPLVRELSQSPDVDPVVVVTGQHREMLDQVNQLFDITPEIDLNLMRQGASIDQIAANALTGCSEAIRAISPDAVVVQGDTTSAFAGGLAAFYLGLPVVHLEAGLRTHNMRSPFPEEANRRLLAPVTDLHLAPTATSRGNLIREGISPELIAVTGNTVIDALLTSTDKAVVFTDPALASALDGSHRVLLVTAHRRESWGERMREAMQAVADIADANPDLLVVMPMHRNQLVRDVIEPTLGAIPNVLLTEPLSYHEFAHALRASTVVLTDSGGVQEEAPSLGKPVLVMRDTTERPEAVASGTVRLVGTSRALVASAVQELLDDQIAYGRMANAVNPYGDGKAASRAVAAILHLFGRADRSPDFSA